MARFAGALAGSLLALAGVTPTLAAAENLWLRMQAPGEIQELSEAELPPPSAANTWYALTLEGRSVNITPVTSTRRPTATVSFGALDETDTVRPPPPPKHYELALPVGAAFAFQPAGDEPVEIRPGRYPSALAEPLALKPNLAVPVRVLADPWTLVTRAVTRPDRKTLDGSLSLLARNARGEDSMLVPPAAGMAFSIQQIVWLGRLTSRSTLDVLVRRTWLTGEVDYVLSVAGAMGVVTLDDERPARAFSSGVENWRSVITPAGQTHVANGALVDAASVTLDDVEWNAAYEKAAAAGVPARMLERTLTFRGAPVRLSIDYLPMWTDAYGGPGSASSAAEWLGSALIKVTYAGKTQTLSGLSVLNDGPFVFSIGAIRDEIVIDIAHWPHYNNEVMYRWVRRESDGRFVRTYVYQSQGC